MYIIGAMYAQVAAAMLCAMNNGMKTNVLAKICRRVGETIVRLHSNAVDKVRNHLPGVYVTAISDVVYGIAELDPVLNTFYSELAPTPMAAAACTPMRGRR